MKVPRDLITRVTRIEKIIRQILPEKATPDEIRHAIKCELAEERFNDLILQWEADFEAALNGSHERQLTEAVDELIGRIKREPVMTTSAFGPRVEAKSHGSVTTLAQVYVTIVENLRDHEIFRIRRGDMDPEGWEPLKPLNEFI